MSLYTIVPEHLPAMDAPILITAFDAWVDAAGAATGAAEHVAGAGEVLARFDTDALLDYRARRPILDIVDGEAASLQWHDIILRHVRAGKLDLLVLTGPEPDLRWKEFSAAIVELALRLGVIRSIALGAIPAAVPHTRPIPLLSTASPRSLLTDEDRAPEGLLRVPAAALSVIQMSLAEHGLPTVGFYAQIPHYVSAPFAVGSIALLERLARHLGVDLDLGALPAQAAEQRTQLDAVVESRPEVSEYVERLEQVAPDVGIAPGGRIPSGDEIAAEVERFLRGQRE